MLFCIFSRAIHGQHGKLRIRANNRDGLRLGIQRSGKLKIALGKFYFGIRSIRLKLKIAVIIKLIVRCEGK